MRPANVIQAIGVMIGVIYAGYALYDPVDYSRGDYSLSAILNALYKVFAALIGGGLMGAMAGTLTCLVVFGIINRFAGRR